jgi:hypothetical protein
MFRQRERRLFTDEAAVSTLDMDYGKTPQLDPRISWARNIPASVIDNEGLNKTAKANEVRFSGAKRVENLCRVSSENMGAALTILNGGNTALGNNLTFNGGINTYLLYDVITTTIGNSYRFSCNITSGTKAGNIYIGNQTAAQYLTITPGIERRYTFLFTASATSVYIGFVNADANTGTVIVNRVMFENVTGQDNKNPSEYVSVGVLSAPWHGAGVDGVKYFNTTNGNTVSGNVVTEAPGTPLTGITLLAEEARANLTLYSIAINATNYTSNPTLAIGQLAPDGSLNASLVTGTGTSISQRLYQNTPLTIVAGSIYTYSCYIAAGTERYFCITAVSGSDYIFAVVDTTNWTIVNTTNKSGGGVFISSSISPVLANGFRRLSVIGTLPITNPVIRCSFTNDVNVPSPVYSTSGTATIWQIQGELGYTASSPIFTAAAAVTRLADVPSLLGTQSVTNLALYSATINSTNYTSNPTLTIGQLAPDGSSTATLVTGSGTNVAQRLLQTAGFAITANAVYTVSFYLVAGTERYVSLNFVNTGTVYIIIDTTNWTIVNSTKAVGSGVYVSSSISVALANGFRRITLTGSIGETAGAIRIALTNDVNATQPAYSTSGTAIIWGIQCELGTTAGAYVPTTTAAVTALTAPPTWYNSQQGTFVIKASGQYSSAPANIGVWNPLLTGEGTYVITYKNGTAWLWLPNAQAGVNPVEYQNIPTPTTILLGEQGLLNLSKWAYYPKALSNSKALALVNGTLTTAFDVSYAAVTNFDQMFRYFPYGLRTKYFPKINTSSGLSFLNTWYGNLNIKSMPSLNLAPTNCNSMFGTMGLTYLQKFDTSKVGNNSGTFRYFLDVNPYLTTIEAGMFDNAKTKDYTGAFTDCGLNQTSIDNILRSIRISVDNNPTLTGGTLNMTGGTNAEPSSAGLADKTILISTYGWTVTNN